MVRWFNVWAGARSEASVARAHVCRSHTDRQGLPWKPGRRRIHRARYLCRCR